MKESLSRKLTFGIFYLLSSSVFSLGLNVITVGFIAHSLGVEGFGLYSTIYSFVGLFQFLTDFGLNKTLLKFGSTDKTKAQISFGNALVLKSILIIPTIFLVTFFGFLSGYRNEQILILELFTLSLVFDSFATVFSSIRRILGSFKLISFFRVLRTAINLGIIFVALNINNSVLYLAFAVALLSFVIFIISLINTILLLKPKLRLSLIKEFFKDSVIFSLSDFFLNVYGRISTVLLSFSYDMHTVGIYSAAVRFTRIANLLPNQVKFALLPTMYRILDNERKENSEVNRQNSKRVFLILIQYMVIFATPLSILIYFFSEHIIHIVFGKKYNLSVPLVQLFSVFIYLRFIETPFSLFYIALHKHKNMVYLQGITSFINVVLNIILIPTFSIFGACYSTLISESFLALMFIIIGRKYKIWRFKNIFAILWKPTLAGIVSLFISNIVLKNTNIFLQSFIFLIFYTILLFAFKLFNKNDKELFVKIFANVKT